ncbi:MAG: hypothetical protein RML84_09300 [Anaerolineae bacterium]|nr:hypothetical protein [Anaerolineae bacterium]
MKIHSSPNMDIWLSKRGKFWVLEILYSSGLRLSRIFHTEDEARLAAARLVAVDDKKQAAD